MNDSDPFASDAQYFNISGAKGEGIVKGSIPLFLDDGELAASLDIGHDGKLVGIEVLISDFSSAFPT
ncbi:hypothetical protein [Corynebacterium sp. p3-SID1194]|uniref:hypothetical protein n=1 Tax=Corynebacterium sp. p3-SID1194 TaxID=2916105 RepID=UPI0021A64FB3|nr:hypothetical protein [Corynebacterium sp. p3-SID1194]MCT1450080.1 hypothetical protein [Corynebacterium sp. p3-SID1194]